MSRIYKIICSELKFLFRTVALIGAILLFFISALLSVISVLIDIPEGFYSGLNDLYPIKTLSISDIDTETAKGRNGTPIYGTVYGITRYSTVTAKNTVTLTPSPSASALETEPIMQQASISLSAYMISEGGMPYFEEYSGCVKKGEFPDEDGEMTLCSDVAAMIGASIGDEVTFAPDLSYVDPDKELDLSDVEPMTFKITGIIDLGSVNSLKNSDPKNHPIPTAHMYLISDRIDYSLLCIEYDDARTIHSEIKYFTDQGKTVTPHDTNAYEIIDTAVAFFAAVCAVLGLMVVFIIYALIALFYRQRKGMICRLKLFGATDKQIGLVYCTITVTLIFVGMLVGSALAMAFNVYFINLCGEMFTMMSSNFVSHFRPVVQATVFAVLTLITIGLFLNFDRKIKRAPIAAEVRYE